MIQRIKKFFVTTRLGGLVVMLPLAIFIALFSIVWGFIQNLLAPFTDYIAQSTEWSNFIINTIAIAGLILIFFGVGIIVRTNFGQSIIDFLERELLQKLPFYGAIKKTVQQFSGGKEMPFSKVVLVDVFNTGTRMTGFVTDRLDSGDITVFVPTGPNPTNGYIFHLKPDQVEEIDATTEEAMRSIVGIGVGSNKVIRPKSKN